MKKKHFYFATLTALAVTMSIGVLMAKPISEKVLSSENEIVAYADMNSGEECLEHDLTLYEAKEPTCTEVGWNAYEICTKCEYTTYVEIPEKGHTEVTDEAVEATCTTTGLTEGKHCSVCEAVLIEQKVVEKIEHDYKITVIESSGMAEKYTQHECVVCGYTYYTGTCGVPTWRLELDEGILTVSGTGATGDYSNRRTTWYEYGFSSKIKHLIVEEGVYRIGKNTFAWCTNLTSVTLPESLLGIDSQAFARCENLTSIVIPDSVTYIGDTAFYNCSGLASIKLSNSLSVLNDSVFAGCVNLKNIEIPNTIEVILRYAFAGCGFKSIVLPEGLTRIREYTFSNCQNLENIVIPDSVTSIDKYAFYKCNTLSSVEIPSSVTSIGDNAFEECNSLTKINVSDIGVWNNIKFGSEYANPFRMGAKLYLNDELVTELFIPNGVTSIGNLAFSYCDSLTSVVISDSVISIGGGAFKNCSNLINVKISNSVTSIGGSAFENCSALTKIDIPNSVTNIEGSAFKDCSALTSIVIPEGVTKIGGYTFYNCGNLTSVEIPNSITNIEYYTFYACGGLMSVKLPNGVTGIGEYAFARCSCLKSIEIPNSVTGVGNYAFGWCSSLTDVYYTGAETEWNNIFIGSGNYHLENAKKYYNYSILDHEHDYNSFGKCKICKQEDPNYNGAYISASEVLLNEGISIEFKIYASALFDLNGTIVVESGIYRNGTFEPVEYTYHFNELRKDDKGRYLVRVNLNPAQMNDTVKTAIYKADGDQSDEYEYSVVTFAKNRLKSSALPDKTRKLIEAMLHYGAATQIFLDYRTDALADKFLMA